MDKVTKRIVVLGGGESGCGAAVLAKVKGFDVFLSDKGKISPIEVKSSGYKTHKSLDVFCSKFSDRIMSRYLIYTKDYRRENGVEYIPVYMTMFL